MAKELEATDDDRSVPTRSMPAWRGDLLNREKDAHIVLSFLDERVAERKRASKVASYALNIDAGWGQGKTYFLRNLKLQLEAAGRHVVYVNAWEDDHASDPLIAVMAAVERDLAQKHKLGTAARKGLAAAGRAAGRLSVTALKHAGSQFARRHLGEDGLAEIAGQFAKEAGEASSKSVETFLDEQASALIKSFEKSRTDIERFRVAVSRIAMRDKDEVSAMYVLVDELDRCRPAYAVALLERMKHLFSVDGVVFVVATDTAQLQHAIGAVYGSSFDASGYLRRFFDRTYRFDKPQIDDFVAQLFAEADFPEGRLSVPRDQTPATVFAAFARSLDLSLRDCEQCFDSLASVITLWPSQVSDKVPIELMYLIPLIAVSHKFPDYTADFARGHQEPVLRRVAGDHPSLKFNYYDGMNHQVEQPTFLAVAQQFGSRAQRNLAEIVRDSSQGGASDWVRSRFTEELHKLHGGVLSQHVSVLLRYVELVRTAGRIKA